MVLAYTTPTGWSTSSLIVYACVTNILLMTLYSANNMPYAALGGVMTGDVDERAKPQLLSLRRGQSRATRRRRLHAAAGGQVRAPTAKANGRATGWQITMGMWAVSASCSS